MNLFNIIRKPVVTEKSAQMQEKGVYSFWVDRKATKIDIKKAVKAIYGVDASEVKIINVSEKIRSLRKGSYNKRPEPRKAYVTMAGNVKLDLNKFEKSDKETKVKLAAPKKSKAEKPAKKTASKESK